MSLIEAIRTYLCSCPFLHDGKMNVDYLGAGPVEYTVDSVPATDVVRTYTDGGKLKQYLFVFASREYYGGTVRKQIENSGFYERFSAWLSDNTAAGLLPVLDAGRTAQAVEALTTGYLFDANEKNARYQIQCRLVYFEEAAEWII